MLPYTDHCRWDLVSSSARRCCVQTVVAGIDLRDRSITMPYATRALALLVREFTTMKTFFFG